MAVRDRSVSSTFANASRNFERFFSVVFYSRSSISCCFNFDSVRGYEGPRIEDARVDFISVKHVVSSVRVVGAFYPPLLGLAILVPPTASRE